MTKWCSAPRSATTRASTIRSGWNRKASSVDFQVGVNEYLYGTRFFSYLALNYSPEKVVQWLRRDEGSKAYYASQFRQVFGTSLDERVGRLDRVGKDFPEGQSGVGRGISADAGDAAHQGRARVGVADLL